MTQQPEAERAQEEAALARGAASGRREDFGELARRFEAPLFRYLLALCGSREDAEELTQETLLRAWRNMGRYDPHWRFSTWLFTLGRRLSISRHRRRRTPEGVRVELDSLAGSADPRSALAEREGRDQLWSLAERVLGEEQRSALWLRYAEDLSAEEIARIQGRRAGAVRVALHRARLLLAEHLDPGCVEEPLAQHGRAEWSDPLAGPLLELNP